jgi:hypothetical protein
MQREAFLGALASLFLLRFGTLGEVCWIHHPFPACAHGLCSSHPLTILDVRVDSPPADRLIAQSHHPFPTAHDLQCNVTVSSSTASLSQAEFGKYGSYPHKLEYYIAVINYGPLAESSHADRA